MRTKEAISERLRQFYVEKYSTQADFARALGIVPQNITPYLKGERSPGAKMQSKLRDLGCDIEWLMTGKTAKEYKTQEENAELLRLREENEMLRADRDALARTLAPETVRAILSGVRYSTGRKRKK